MLDGHGIGSRIQVGQSVAVPTGFWLTRYDAQWQLTDLSQDLVLNRAADQSEVNFDALNKRFQLEQDRTNRNNQTLLVAVESTILITTVALFAVAITFVVVLARSYRRRR